MTKAQKQLKKKSAFKSEFESVFTADEARSIWANAEKRLDEIGLISKKIYPEVPPRTEYSMTLRGNSLMPHVNGLIGWAAEHIVS